MQTRTFADQQVLTRCPACHSVDLIRHHVVGDFHYGIDGEFSSDRCLSCGTVFMNPMPSVRDLKKLYPDDYYSYQSPAKPGLKRRLANLVLRYPRRTHLPRFAHPGVMLDVGCGAGHYLYEMRGRGWTVYGSELSEAAAAAGKQAGLDIRSGELTDAGFAPKMFDFVRSNHALEHIPNPDAILGEMRRLLKDDGTLFIGVPNVEGLFAQVFGKHWWNYGLPVHVINYTERGLRTILERNGFKPIRTLHNSDYSGLTGSFQIRANAKAGIKSSSGTVYNNKLLRVPANMAAKVTDAFGQGDCMEMIAIKA